MISSNMDFVDVSYGIARVCGVGNLNNINVDDIEGLIGIDIRAQHHPQQK